MNKNHNSICTKCHRIYSKETSKLDTCAPCSDAIAEQKGQEPNMTCMICEERYYSPNHLKKCPSCSFIKYSEKSRKPRHYDIHKVHKKRRGALPYEVLNKIAEKKRIYDETHANNFIRWGGLRDRV